MFAKRALDIICATSGLVLLSLPLLCIALWVRLDSAGPALFRQIRVGREGRPFTLLKFRTMRADAGREGSAITVAEDSRVTKAGRWLRAKKLDELPQLVNVLRGEMSLVGPRPEVPEYVAYYSDEERADVLSVRPGLTDEAAIAFRNEGQLLEGKGDVHQYYVESILPVKIRMYREYVRRRSFWHDLTLIFRTLRAIASHD